MNHGGQCEQLRQQIAMLRDELAAARERELVLEQLLGEKDEFLAILGHELRKPLGAITAAVTLQQSIPVAESRLVRARAVIARQTAHMSRMVEDIFDLTRLTRGRVKLRTELHDITALVRSSVDDFADVIALKALDLHVDLPSRPLWVIADPTRFSQVLANLLDNAIKFTRSPGRIGVRVWCADATASDQAQVIVAVSDTGVGMEPSTLDAIFERRGRLGRQKRPQHGEGLGVGLALVRALVELHEGSVEAHSAGLGQGSEFLVRLPLSSARPEARPVLQALPATR